MTTSIQYVVDTDATLDEADALAQTVVAYLCDRGIILPTPQHHEYLENGPRYAKGPNALDAADTINDCFPCGMDVSIGRNVFCTGEMGFDLFCPNCKCHSDKDAINWAAPVVHWCESGDASNLSCSQCCESTPFTEWFRPPFGFGNLSFGFSEWFLKQEFVDDLSELLQHRVTWVQAQY